jgi:hypothetical protein
MKSRRFIGESLLEPQSWARDAVQAKIGSLLHGDASKHKQSQAKVYLGIFGGWRRGHAGGALTRFSGWISANLGRKSRILCRFLLFSLNGVYKIR